MGTEILEKDGTKVIWAHGADFDDNPNANTLELDFSAGAAGLANAAAWQGASADLGAVRAKWFTVTLNMEIDVAPVSGVTVDLYWAPSEDDAAFPGGVSGSDATYTGTGGDSIADSVKQLTFIGSLVCTADADPAEQQMSWRFHPLHRYGAPVVYNLCGQAGVTDGTHMYLSFTPIPDEIQ